MCEKVWVQQMAVEYGQNKSLVQVVQYSFDVSFNLLIPQKPKPVNKTKKQNKFKNTSDLKNL